MALFWLIRWQRWQWRRQQKMLNITKMAKPCESDKATTLNNIVEHNNTNTQTHQEMNNFFSSNFFRRFFRKRKKNNEIYLLNFISNQILNCSIVCKHTIYYFGEWKNSIFMHYMFLFPKLFCLNCFRHFNEKWKSFSFHWKTMDFQTF